MSDKFNPVKARCNLPRSLCWFIGVTGIVVLSPDSLLLRLVSTDSASIVALRALFSALSLLLFIALLPPLRHNFRWRPVLTYGACYAVGLACFPLSILNTHVANTLVIISVAPILAAIGARWVLGERTRPVTWVAAWLVFLGMAVIFFDAVGGGGLLGDIFALVVALSLAATSITVRRYPQTAVYPGLVVGSLLITAGFGAVAGWQTLDSRDIIILAIDGVIVMSVSFLLLITAARGLAPAEFNLLFFLETVLGTFWVWLLLGEVPPPATVTAGVLIIIVLVLHTVWLIKPGLLKAKPPPVLPGQDGR